MLNSFLRIRNVFYINILLSIHSPGLRASDEIVQPPRAFNITSHLYGVLEGSEKDRPSLQPSVNKLQNKFDIDKKESFYKWLRDRDNRWEEYKKARSMKDPELKAKAIRNFIGPRGYYRTILSQHELENLIYSSVFNPRKKFKAEYKQHPYKTSPQHLKGRDRVVGFVLTPLDLRISLPQLQRLVTDLEREIFVLERILISHQADLKKLVNGWSPAQLSEWWTGMPTLIKDLQKKISDEVIEKFGPLQNKKNQRFNFSRSPLLVSKIDAIEETDEERKFKNIYHGFDTIEAKEEYNNFVVFSAITSFTWRKIILRKKPREGDGSLYIEGEGEREDFRVPSGTKMADEYIDYSTLRKHRLEYLTVLLELKSSFKTTSTATIDSQSFNSEISPLGILAIQPEKKWKFVEPEADFSSEPEAVKALLKNIRTPPHNSEEVKKWQYDPQDLIKYKELHDQYNALLEKQRSSHQTLHKKSTYFGFNSCIPTPWELFFIQQQNPSTSDTPLKSSKKE